MVENKVIELELGNDNKKSEDIPQQQVLDPDSAVYVVAPGHYQLPNFKSENGTLVPFTTDEGLMVTEIKFVQETLGKEKQTIKEGVTNLALLAMMVFNLHSAHSKTPCREMAIAITKLEEAELWLRKHRIGEKERQKQNLKQKVKGNNNETK